jgi:L-iditol 2-dehydrogenase
MLAYAALRLRIVPGPPCGSRHRVRLPSACSAGLVSYWRGVTVSEMRAAVMHGIGDIRLETRPIPVPGPGEALVKVKSVGICGSDVHYYEEGRIGRYVVEQPIILGHECAGQVVELGQGTTRVRVGDRVAVEPGQTCGTCGYCKSGRYNLCPDVKFLATPPHDGSFCEFIAMRQDLLFRLPPEMSYEEGTAMEPLSVGIQACLRGRVTPGDSVVITGAGPIGLMTVVAAQSFGAYPIVILDREELRLSVASRLGSTAALNIDDPDHATEAREALGGGASVAIECAGNGSALKLGISLLRRGGRAVVVGLPSQPVQPIDLAQVADGELELLGVFRYANSYPLAISTFQRFRGDLEAFWTARYPLSRVNEAMETAHIDKARQIKILIDPEK